MCGGIIACVMACAALRVCIVPLRAGYASGVIRGYALPSRVNPTPTRANKRGVERCVMGCSACDVMREVQSEIVAIGAK